MPRLVPFHNTPEAARGLRFLHAHMMIEQREGRRLHMDELARRLAKRLGVPAREAPAGGTVSRWESGKLNPPARWAEALADEAGVDVGWLYFGTKSAAPAPTSLVLAVRALPAPPARRKRAS